MEVKEVGFGFDVRNTFFKMGSLRHLEEVVQGSCVCYYHWKHSKLGWGNEFVSSTRENWCSNGKKEKVSKILDVQGQNIPVKSQDALSILI